MHQVLRGPSNDNFSTKNDRLFCNVFGVPHFGSTYVLERGTKPSCTVAKDRQRSDPDCDYYDDDHHDDDDDCDDHDDTNVPSSCGDDGTKMTGVKLAESS